MSDQYTRITCGGTPLSTTTPVVGLLFGTYHHELCDIPNTGSNPSSNKKDNTTTLMIQVNVMDADEIPVTQSETEIVTATTQISLHQAVFDKHVVVGWYRVSTTSSSSNKQDDVDDDGPTYDDLRITKELKEHYQNNDATTTNDMKNNNNPFIFALLQVEDYDQQQLNQKPKAKTTTNIVSSNVTSMPVDDGNYDDDDEGLPLTLYQLSTDHQVLIAIEDEWRLDTSPSEKVAVESVMKEQQQPKHEKSFYYPIVSSPSPTNTSKQPSKTTMIKIPSSIIQSNKLIHETIPIQHSIDAIQKRMKIINQFVSNTMSKTIPYNPTLLRQVHCLILQNHLLSSLSGSHNNEEKTSVDANNIVTTSNDIIATPTNDTTNTTNTFELLQHLTILANTVNAIQAYTDKVKFMVDATASSNTSGGGGSSSGGLAALVGGGGKMRLSSAAAAAATNSNMMMSLTGRE